MLEHEPTAEGGSATAGQASSAARVRPLSAAQQAVNLRPIPVEAIQAGGAAAVALAVKIDEETNGPGCIRIAGSAPRRAGFSSIAEPSPRASVLP